MRQDLLYSFPARHLQSKFIPYPARRTSPQLNCSNARNSTIILEGRQFWPITETASASSFLRFASIQGIEPRGAVTKAAPEEELAGTISGAIELGYPLRIRSGGLRLDRDYETKATRKFRKKVIVPRYAMYCWGGRTFMIRNKLVDPPSSRRARQRAFARASLLPHA